MSVFVWAGGGAPPPQWDLRRAGWTLADGEAAARQVELVDVRGRDANWMDMALQARPEPAMSILLGVDDGAVRAWLLKRGCGEALPASVRLEELDQRARRLRSLGDTLPRRRRVGPLVLDLLRRDACAEDRWLALHPREFDLMWRLADRPGEPVSRSRLLRDVWRLDFEPGTNSVEVHVSRLRSKLASAGLRGLIETHANGGYRLAPDKIARGRRSADRRLCA